MRLVSPRRPILMPKSIFIRSLISIGVHLICLHWLQLKLCFRSLLVLGSIRWHSCHVLPIFKVVFSNELILETVEAPLNIALIDANHLNSLVNPVFIV